jgi:hypothetical protein
MNNFRYINAYFRNEQRDSVMSYWEDPDNPGALVEIIMETKDEDPQWKELLEHVTVDEIHENTWTYTKESEQAFKDQVIEIAKEKGWLVNLDDGGTSDFHKILIDLIFDPYDEKLHKEKLFFFKLQLFEKEFVKQCKDKDLKKKIRRSNTPIDALRAAIEIFDASQAQASSDASD